MLKRVRKSSTTPLFTRIAIVASEYNRKHVDGMVDQAQRVLRDARVEVDVLRVPGAFEIPVVVESIAGQAGRPFSAILALGVIIRGETAHADLVGQAVTSALMETAVRHRVPVIHEVLLVASKAQADARCLDPRFNRGGGGGADRTVHGAPDAPVAWGPRPPRVSRRPESMGFRSSSSTSGGVHKSLAPIMVPCYPVRVSGSEPDVQT